MAFSVLYSKSKVSCQMCHSVPRWTIRKIAHDYHKLFGLSTRIDHSSIRTVGGIILILAESQPD